MTTDQFCGLTLLCSSVSVRLLCLIQSVCTTMKSYYTIITDRDKNGVFLDMYACPCAAVQRLICVRGSSSMCNDAWFICPLCGTCDNKPITEADGKRWAMRAPSLSGEWDWEGLMMRAVVDWVSLCLARPPSTCDQGQGSTVNHSWYRPYCYRERIHTKRLSKVMLENTVSCCFVGNRNSTATDEFLHKLLQFLSAFQIGHQSYEDDNCL